MTVSRSVTAVPAGILHERRNWRRRSSGRGAHQRSKAVVLTFIAAALTREEPPNYELEVEDPSPCVPCEQWNRGANLIRFLRGRRSVMKLCLQ
ncbi:hypothetical protein Taro_047039 [Colocasia esculenta]|uniref:Uncharacterized protein n=1 Tax=Colocasia esculenta TaxID=4460 RepID=A0A843WU54_COLES|nr:hypothetical protein [Colocasia esculenta]